MSAKPTIIRIYTEGKSLEEAKAFAQKVKRSKGQKFILIYNFNIIQL